MFQTKATYFFSFLEGKESLQNSREDKLNSVLT